METNIKTDILESWIDNMLKDQREENEESVLRYLMDLKLSTLLTLEERCPLLKSIMEGQHWWELLYAKWFPVTYDRLQHKPIASNAKQYINSQSKSVNTKNLYRNLWILQGQWMSNVSISSAPPSLLLTTPTFKLTTIPKGACISTSIGDEFGLGPLFATRSTEVLIGVMDQKDENVLDENRVQQESNRPIMLKSHENVKSKEFEWTKFPLGIPERYGSPTTKYLIATAIPLQNKLILRIIRPNGEDVILLNVNASNPNHIELYKQDMSFWAINYPDNDRLDLHLFMDGDPTLQSAYPPCIAATEKNAKLSSIQHNGAFAVMLNRENSEGSMPNHNTPTPNDLLIFDQAFQKNEVTDGPMKEGYTWRNFCTSHIKINDFKIYSNLSEDQKEVIGITGMTYILDTLLLMACSDGSLWARPRNNPRSMYFVEQFPTPITSLTSLYNVIAFICHGTLYVKRVKKINIDPFISLDTIYSIDLGIMSNGADHKTGEAPNNNNIEENDTIANPSKTTISQPLLFGPYMVFQTSLMEESDDGDEDEDIKAEKREKERREFERREYGIIPKVENNGRNWWRDKDIANKQYEERKKKEDTERLLKKEAQKHKPIKKEAQYILINYETKTETKVQFPSAVMLHGWRLFQIKIVNHSHWVLTLYSHKKFMDVILH